MRIMKTILQITLILLLIVLAVELVFPSAIIIGFALTKASPCPRTQVVRGIQARLRFTKTLGAYRSSEAVFKQTETDHRGFELWSSTSKGIWTVKGEKITDDVPSVNFRIYWDGDLQDELLDRSYIDDWDFKNNKAVRLLDASQDGGSSINGTKANPIISADILGDWREEVIFRGRDNASLLLYSTTIPTEYRMVTPMQDNVYRKGIAWQNVVYNQPPHLGYYIGDGIPKDKMKQ